MKNYNELVKTVLHVHPGGTPNDAVHPERQYADAAIEAGYTAMTVTDHGGFTAMQTLIDYAKTKENFRIIYGVEAYIEIPPFSIKEKVGHMLLLAATERGRHIIDHLVSNGIIRKSGKSVMLIITYDMLSSVPDLKGNVIATSACVAGAPATALLINELTEALIVKEKEKFGEVTKDGSSKCMSPKDITYIHAKKAHEVNIHKVQTLNELINGEAVKKQKKDLVAKRSQAKALKDAELLKEAQDKLDELSANIDKAKKDLAAVKNDFKITGKALKTYEAKVGRYNEIAGRIHELEARLVSDDEKELDALEQISKYAKLFGRDNYYVELQYHGLTIEREVYPVLAKIAKENGYKVVAANDVHIPRNTESDIMMRKVAKALRFNKVDEGEGEAADREMYMKTPNELAEALSKILPENIVDEAMLNLNEIAEKCMFEPTTVAHYPKFSKDIDSAELLRKEAYKGIPWRYPNPEDWNDKRQARLDYELDTIISMGFADYLLIVKDFLEYGRIIGMVPQEKLNEVPLSIEGAKAYVEEHGYDIGLGIGPGRGSVAGSAVAYVLGITSIDPFRFDLVFERFLNPERVTMPDIDTDLAPGVREKDIEYVRAKFGNDAVVGIITQAREGVKGAIRDAATYLGLARNTPKAFLSLGENMRKKVPAAINITFDSVVGTEEIDGDGNTIKGDTVYDVLMDEYYYNEDAVAILKIAKCLEGMLCSFGQHAAGVIIYDDNDINDYIPTSRNQDGEKITCMDMVQCEEQKLLKMDFLGLKTLAIITDCCRLIYARTGRKIDPIKDILLEGSEAEAVYEKVYANGNTKDIFQFESPGMRKYLKQLKPKCIDDIIAMNALYRPGPLDSIPEYIEGALKARAN